MWACPNTAASICMQGQWSIGIFKGTSPLMLKPLEDLYSNTNATTTSKQQLKADIAGFGVANPTYTCAHVTDVPASFVADPFLWPMQVSKSIGFPS